MTLSLPHPMSATQTARAVDEIGQLAQLRGAAPIPVIGLDPCRTPPHRVRVEGDVVQLRFIAVGPFPAVFAIHGENVRLRAAPRQCDRPPD